MKKTTGVISFFGTGIGLIFLIYIFFYEEVYNQTRDYGFLLWIALFILGICVYFITVSRPNSGHQKSQL